MKYRTMGTTGKHVSALGFGCMRLPTIGGDSGNIDQEKATEMIEYALDKGINYFDTAYIYHVGPSGGQGRSEFFVGKALKAHREKVYIATKLPSWLIHIPSDNEKYLNRQLKALDTDYIDFYLLHGLNADLYERLKKNGVFEFLEQAKKDGRIRHIGFSFHDEYESFETIVNDYDWEFCQIQYNFLDREFQAGEAGLDIAKKKGLGVVIMEPLRGGLITDVVQPAKDILTAYDPDRPIVEWAFSWLYHQRGISTVLSGMSTLDQVKQNIEIANKYDAGYLPLDELNAIEKATGIIKRSIKVPCTGCRYCMPCPQGVDIPLNFTAYNTYHYFEPGSEARKRSISHYHMFTEEAVMAKHCIQCKKCESHCPQHIKISDEMVKVSEVFTPGEIKLK